MIPNGKKIYKTSQRKTHKSVTCNYGCERKIRDSILTTISILTYCSIELIRI